MKMIVKTGMNVSLQIEYIKILWISIPYHRLKGKTLGKTLGKTIKIYYYIEYIFMGSVILILNTVLYYNICSNLKI